VTTLQEVNREMMIKKTQLWALAAVVAITGGVYARVSPQDPPTTAAAPTAQERIGKRVSCSFENATIAEVLKWLSTQGQSFVADEAVAASKRKVTVNVVNQPIDDVLNAIADGLNCTWEKKGEVLVLKNSNVFGVLAPSVADVPLEWRQADGLTKVAPKVLTPRALPKIDTKWLTPEVQKQVQTEIEKAMREAQKAIEQAHKSGKAEKMSAAERAEFEKEMKRAKVEMEKAMQELKKELKGKSFILAPDAKGFEKMELDLPMTEFYKFDSKDMPELRDFKMDEKAMKELMKLAPEGGTYKWDYKVLPPLKDQKALKELLKVKPDAKVYKWDSKTAPQLKAFKFDDKALNKKLETFRNLEPKMFIGTTDVQALVKSLTKAQKEKAAKQGYLKPSDLTTSQRKLLGELPSGTNWSIIYEIDGQKVTIKGK